MSLLVATGVVGVGIILFLLKSKLNPKDGKPEQFVLRTLKAPKVNMAIFVRLLEFPFIGALVCKILYKTNHFHTLRDVDSSTLPTFYPLVHYEKQQTPPDTITCEEFLKEILDNQIPGVSPFVSVLDYAVAFRKRETTPLIVANNVIQAIEDSNNGETPLTAFIAVNKSNILEQAHASAARYEAGTPLSVLDGVPIGVKDEFDVAGYPTTVGTAYLKTVALQDATAANKLRELGAILIGKTNMHEIGISTVGFNPHHGTPRNPYDPSRYCGGSSSGSAAVVGAGICPIAVAADGGGSIRVPAGLCGAVGLKATFGRISEFGAYPLCWTVAHAGPIGSCVNDCAIAYAAMCGPDTKDAHSLSQPIAWMPRFSSITNTKPLEGLRIGIYDPWATHANSDMVQAYNKVVNIMCDLGAVTRNVKILDGLLEQSRIAHSFIISTEMATSMNANYRHNRTAMGYDVRASLAIVRQGSSLDYLQANRIRTMAIESLKSLFEEIDVIVTPNTAVEAPKMPAVPATMDLEMLSLLMRFAFLGNLTGIPAIAFPGGYVESSGVKVPLGVQIQGKWWDEHTLLKIAYVVEQHIQKQAPKIHYNKMF